MGVPTVGPSGRGGKQTVKPRATSAKNEARRKATKQARARFQQHSVTVGVGVLDLLREILTWDYLHMLKLRVAETERNDSRRGGNRGKAGKALPEVRNAYTDIDDYTSTFKPLLLEECKEMLVKGWFEPEYLLYKSTLQSSFKSGAKSDFLTLKFDIEGDNLW